MAGEPFSPKANERTTKLTHLETTKQEEKIPQSNEILVDFTWFIIFKMFNPNIIIMFLYL